MQRVIRNNIGMESIHFSNSLSMKPSRDRLLIITVIANLSLSNDIIICFSFNTNTRGHKHLSKWTRTSSLLLHWSRCWNLLIQKEMELQLCKNQPYNKKKFFESALSIPCQASATAEVSHQQGAGLLWSITLFTFLKLYKEIVILKKCVCILSIR